MNKVGILTYHHAINYGATLQAYALWQTVKKQGFEVDFIDYRPIKAVKTYLLNRNLLTNLGRSWKIEKFLRENASLGEGRTYTKAGLKQKNLPYDVAICGSDEVWNIKSFRGFDASYFLDFISGESIRRVSYAASFGSTKTLGEHQAEISKLLGKFDFVSVRDSNSLELIRREGGIQAVQVLDPTFLADYSQITLPIKAGGNYLLIYSIGLTASEDMLVQSIATARGLTIVSIGFHNKVAQKNLVNVSTEEWLGYFSKASYVVTSFYHGTIFSIIFKKQFSVLSRGDKSIKVSDLMSHLELSDRLWVAGDGFRFSEQQNLDIDYDAVDERLTKSISLSRDFLMEALNAEH